MDERLERTVQAIREVGADWGVLASVDGVAYATGHYVPIEAGPSPFAGGPTIALVDRNGAAGLVCANVEGAAAAASRVTDVVQYEGYAFDHDVSYIDNYRTAVAVLVERLGVGGRVAAERGHFPLVLGDLITVDAALDLTPPLRRLRATKTADELTTLRRCAEAVAIGQQRFLGPCGPAGASSRSSPTFAVPSRSSPAIACRSRATSSLVRRAPLASPAGRSIGSSSPATR